MTLDEFIRKYEGKGIDFDGHYGAQCVDLYRQYVKEVLEFPQSPPVPGAKDIWDSYLPEYFQRIGNTPYGVPEKGDIVIFGTGIGKWGHVSIFLEGNTTRFTSLDQNYPAGSLVHKQGHTYNAVIGWLRPLKKNTMELPEWLRTLLRENNQNPGGNWEPWFREVLGKSKDYDANYQDTLKRLSEAESRAGDCSQANALLVEDKAKLTERVLSLEDSLNQARSERNQASWEAEKLEIQNQRLQEENQELFDKNSDLRLRIKELTQTKLEKISWWDFIKYKLGGDKSGKKN